MTNYEKIKNMTVEEMAETIIDVVEDCQKYCVFTKDGKCNSFGANFTNCKNGVKQWLESEESK